MIYGQEISWQELFYWPLLFLLLHEGGRKRRREGGRGFTPAKRFFFIRKSREGTTSFFPETGNHAQGCKRDKKKKCLKKDEKKTFSDSFFLRQKKIKQSLCVCVRV